MISLSCHISIYESQKIFSKLYYLTFYTSTKTEKCKYLLNFSMHFFTHNQFVMRRHILEIRSILIQLCSLFTDVNTVNQLMHFYFNPRLRQ